MKPSLQTRVTLSTMIALGLPLAAALTGCGSAPGEPESKMTSFTSSESKADTAELFTVPKEQMAHLQIVAAGKGPLPRTLRLPVRSPTMPLKPRPCSRQLAAPVHEILVAPGQFVQAGQPLLNVTSPDYSAARSAYIKAREAFTLSDKLFTRAQDLFAHGAISEADLQQRKQITIRRTRTWNPPPTPFARWREGSGLSDRNAARSTSESPVLAPDTGEIVERLRRPRAVASERGYSCFTISNTNTVWSW